MRTELKGITTDHQLCQYQDNDVRRFAAGHCIEELYQGKACLVIR